MVTPPHIPTHRRHLLSIHIQIAKENGRISLYSFRSVMKKLNKAGRFTDAPERPLKKNESVFEPRGARHQQDDDDDDDEDNHVHMFVHVYDDRLIVRKIIKHLPATKANSMFAARWLEARGIAWLAKQYAPDADAAVKLVAVCNTLGTQCRVDVHALCSPVGAGGYAAWQSGYIDEFEVAKDESGVALSTLHAADLRALHTSSVDAFRTLVRAWDAVPYDTL